MILPAGCDGAALGVFEIPDAVRTQMRGVCWRDVPQCPGFDALRLLKLRHRDFQGGRRAGELVVHVRVADEVFAIFERLFMEQFPIQSLRRIECYGADDDASMAANNSSGFNFRVVEGTDALSHHALGLAIDINPVQNPWLREHGRVDPEPGRAYLNREAARAGMIVAGGSVVRAFEDVGWHWGGNFRPLPDYHHFSKLPRPDHPRGS